MRQAIPIDVRLWNRVERRRDDECWIWTGGCDEFGYGSITLGRRGAGHDRTHRVAWRLTHGSIPDGLCVLHSCDNPPCCNPSHLFLGTRRENSADMSAKGRAPGGTARGEAHGCAKLTTTDVLAIREKVARGATQRAVATDHGVAQTLVSRIVRREVWRHIEAAE